MIFKKNTEILKCQDKLYRFSISLTKDINDANDLYQETLLKLLEKREQWNQWKNFEAYAMTTVRNTFLNTTKKQNRVTVLTLQSAREKVEENATESKIRILDLIYRFESLISKLPEIQRQVLYLREIEEMEYKDIGQVLNLTDAQVKVYIFRGRQHLRKIKQDEKQ